jgi:hypothetical protein
VSKYLIDNVILPPEANLEELGRLILVHR